MRRKLLRRAALATIAAAAVAGVVGITDSDRADAYLPSCAYPPCTYDNILPQGYVDYYGEYASWLRSQTPVYTPPDHSAINNARAFQDLKRQLEKAAADKRIDEAVNDAKYLVFEKPCRDYLGNASTGESPLDLLAHLDANDQIINKYDQLGPRGGYAEASGVGAGKNGTITLFKPTFDQASYDADRNRFNPPLTRERWEALVIVHELAHLLGKDHGTDDTAYEDAIAKACFGSSKPQ